MHLHAVDLSQESSGRSDAGTIENFAKTCEGEPEMNKRHFDKLVASVKEAAKIRRREMKASRVFDLKPTDVKAVRRKLNLSQSEFALMIGVRLSTLQNWEQGRRRPDGPAQALLKVAASNPKAVVDALAS
jgi:putative transcriptional regulator